MSLLACLVVFAKNYPKLLCLVTPLLAKELQKGHLDQVFASYIYKCFGYWSSMHLISLPSYKSFAIENFV